MDTERASTIFNFGYQYKSIEQVLAMLEVEKITLLVDLRSVPYSKMNKTFSRPNLERVLRTKRVEYHWAGKNLGGRNPIRENWLAGCKWLARLAQCEVIAIMCMEHDINKCHRNELNLILAGEHKITCLPLFM